MPGVRAVPQRGQKAKPGSQTKPQFAQGVDCDRPQCGQNAKSDASSRPQPLHAMERSAAGETSVLPCLRPQARPRIRWIGRRQRKTTYLPAPKAGFYSLFPILGSPYLHSRLRLCQGLRSPGPARPADIRTCHGEFELGSGRDGAASSGHGILLCSEELDTIVDGLAINLKCLNP